MTKLKAGQKIKFRKSYGQMKAGEIRTLKTHPISKMLYIQLVEDGDPLNTNGYYVDGLRDCFDLAENRYKKNLPSWW